MSGQVGGITYWVFDTFPFLLEYKDTLFANVYWVAIVVAAIILLILITPIAIRCLYLVCWLVPRWVFYVMPRWIIPRILGKQTRPLNLKPMVPLSNVCRWAKNTAQGKKQKTDVELLVESINDLVDEIRKDRSGK